MSKNKGSNMHKPPARGPMRGPMGHGGMGGEKAKNFKGTMKNLLGYMRPYWTSVIVVLIVAMASTIFAIVSPKILGNITSQIVDDYSNTVFYDKMIETLPEGVALPPGTKGEDLLKNAPAEILEKLPADKIEELKTLDLSTRPSINFDKIAQIAVFLLGLYILSAIFSYTQGWIMTGVSQKITFKFRKDISEKINRMPLKYFDSRTHGEVLSRVTNDVDMISQTLNQSMSQMVTSVTMIIGILFMMFSISWQMTLVALLILPVSMGLIGTIVKKTQKFFMAQQETLGRLNGHVEEMYSGHNVMKAFNGEARSVNEFKAINEELYNSAWKSQFLSGLMMPLMGFVGNLGYVGISVLGGYLAIKGKVNVGDIQAFIQYVRQFNQPIAQVANIVNVLQSTAAAAERVFEFLEEEEEVAEKANPATIREVQGHVTFEDVVFGYNPEKVIIKGFNADIKPGQRIAIVGPTGAGKTTMINLLMRFYDVNSGAIKVDGVDIRDMKRHELRQMFGMVLQDTWLFNGSIRDNIKYGKIGATDEEMIAASQAALVDHFVHSLPSGYDMELNEEASNISQGQKQLLTIARAMLADPPMLILDEATSSVDTRTEALIQKAMDNLMHGRTSFVIAHRLSTIKDADLILVMKDGNIIEQGNHQELLAQKGFYEELYNSQFATQGYTEEAV
ncbi:MAG: ABC transporter ATP-binding protein [Cellulosilyticaceae bacterium]